ncbi:hypothetical protein [Gloeocapsopsis dulcis]|uniref:Uncharacterized protein n=1 Tax=Gloeocapsopsis dulcis AAB1 = 1H9 TaxID=1433147 RepID=A0A6N8FU33_9CHRO|nr:hypothetical protein [Gloeocapsopsis dulcis]MUL36618.1 hypothetical protein [Gloeocapsopsis dulcis AAB1 = 1H9]WNN87242.1 hypothetical protein P0S91_12920 [Gloeocapsopsis dulcis]
MFTALRRYQESLAASVAVLLCIFGVISLQVPQLHQLTTHKTITKESLIRETETEKVRLNLLKQLPSFGFDNLIASWIFLNFLQYFGDDEIRPKTGYSLSPEYFEIILDRDPRFLQAYLFLSSSTSLYAGMPERSIALMERNLKLLSPTVPQKSYYIWRYKGIDELLFLGDSAAAQQSFTTAAQWASVYPDEESKQVAAISQKTAEFLSRNPKSKSAQIGAWTMVLSNPVDIATRDLAIRRIQALGGEVSISSEGVVQVKPPKED